MPLTLFRQAAIRAKIWRKKLRNVFKSGPVRRQEIDEELVLLAKEKKELESGNPRIDEINRRIAKLGKERILTLQFEFLKKT